ncbi:MAG TPA: tetratricopeptide repeat protein [Bryobacteraceae bacterium]|nr:tetratricopeptide repeat protein [Bryobacteraceae bacterium]
MVQDLLRKAAFCALPAMLCLCARAEPAPYSSGLVFLSMDKYDIALRFFEQAVKENPKDARAWFQAGFCMGKLGETEAKLRAYRKAIELDPKYADAHYSLGISLLLAGYKCDAVHEIRELQMLDPALAEKLRQLMNAMAGPDECAAAPPAQRTI